jgi:hypothetical protein
MFSSILLPGIFMRRPAQFPLEFKAVQCSQRLEAGQ